MTTNVTPRYCEFETRVGTTKGRRCSKIVRLEARMDTARGREDVEIPWVSSLHDLLVIFSVEWKDTLPSRERGGETKGQEESVWVKGTF